MKYAVRSVAVALSTVIGLWFVSSVQGADRPALTRTLATRWEGRKEMKTDADHKHSLRPAVTCDRKSGYYDMTGGSRTS